MFWERKKSKKERRNFIKKKKEEKSAFLVQNINNKEFIIIVYYSVEVSLSLFYSFHRIYFIARKKELFTKFNLRKIIICRRKKRAGNLLHCKYTVDSVI